MQSTRNKLIAILSEQKDGFISGQKLSEALEISRNSIWKHMKELEKDGYEIEGVPRKGYRIKKVPDKVSENTVKWGLETEWLGKHIIHKESTESTQLLIHKVAGEGAAHGTIAIADEQTGGRGRMKRTWHSSSEKGIWLSILLRPEILPQEAPQLTLLTATVLADVIRKYTSLQPLIKWPNDLLINKKKIAGILTEMQGEQDGIDYIVIGLGFNINQEKNDFPPELQDKSTSLKIASGKEMNLNEFIQFILKEFELAYNEFMKTGFSTIKEKWESYGFRMGEKIKITTGRETFKAVFNGIAEDGALLISNEANHETKIYSGEIEWFETS